MNTASTAGRLTNDWCKPASRIESIEFAGDPTSMKTAFVGTHKTLPIRYRLTSA